MGDSKNSTNNPSLLSFLLLPQFSRMFRSSSHIIPIFMRTIANLLVQSSLIPPTHPSALYGMPGVPKTGLISMLGDAWHTLRSTRATPYQWSIFCSVIFVIFFTLSSGVMAAVNVAGAFTGNAAAQVFTNPFGPTTITSVPLGCSGGSFDKTIPPPSTPHGDYAIMILDKMLRAGAMGGGCPLQNATQALMVVYNSGMMVIAGVMLFWLIISVVVDIARTGQVGGGRHNLVWAPIRIVFALALMIPLGNAGFSTGQFAVMALAEYGSNFGTNAWAAYFKAEQTDPFYRLPSQQNLTFLAGQVIRTWVCNVAHNGYSYQAEGTLLPGDQIVQRYNDVGIFDSGVASYSYRKQTSDNICGRITFPTQNDPVLQALVNNTDGPGGSVDPIEAAEGNFKLQVNQVWENMFYTGASSTNPPPNGGPVSPGMNSPVEAIANQFACGFVAQHIWGTVTPGGDVLSVNCPGGGGGQCGAGPAASGKYPDMTCVNTLVDYMHTQVLQGVQNAYANTFGALTLTQLGATRGWAQMGDFYKKLSEANNYILSQKDIPVHLHAGAMPDEDGLGGKIDEVIDKFDNWWQTVPRATPHPLPPAFQRNANSGGTNPGIAVIGNDSGGSSILGDVLGVLSHIPLIGGLFGGISDIMKLFDLFLNVFKKIGEVLSNPSEMIAKFITNAISGDILDLVLPDVQDKNVYPLMVLTNLGHKLIVLGGGIHLCILGIIVALAVIPLNDAAAAIAGATITTLLGIFGTIFLSCGAVLTYWLPCLPFVRVVHAVLTWAMVVFEAVALMPVAALSFLSTTGEGWDAKHVFLGWLDILTRPVLTVIGYVGSILLFNSFFIYVFDAYHMMLHINLGKQTGLSDILFNLLGTVFYATILVLVLYTSANSCFKLINGIPDAFFRWAPLGQQRSSFGEDGGDHSGAVSKIGNMGGELMGAPAGALARSLRGRGKKDKDGGDDEDPGAKDGGGGGRSS